MSPAPVYSTTRVATGALAPSVLLLSYPKAGRTWLRTLVGKALVDAAAVHDRGCEFTRPPA